LDRLPTQWFRFTGTRSRFPHTVDRADRISPPERRLTEIGRRHREIDRIQLGARSKGIVVEQPVNKNTAAGVFLPLAHVRARDPNATIVIYPSDHFVHPGYPPLRPPHELDYVDDDAMRLVETDRDRVRGPAFDPTLDAAAVDDGGISGQVRGSGSDAVQPVSVKSRSIRPW
jgi:hypothetical protein